MCVDGEQAMLYALGIKHIYTMLLYIYSVKFSAF